MKIAAIICNIFLFLFTSFLLLSEGISGEAVYIALTLLLLLVPVFNIALIYRIRKSYGWPGLQMKKKATQEQGKIENASSVYPIIKIVAVICNLALLGLAFRALADQYPHPGESGFFIYTLLVVLTPILSLVAILIRLRVKLRRTRRIGLIPRCLHRF